MYQLSPVEYVITVQKEEYSERCETAIRWLGEPGCPDSYQKTPYTLDKREPRFHAWWNKMEIERTFSVDVVTTEEVD